MTSTSIHQPLDPANQQIRLLVVTPRFSDRTICGDLETVSLSSKPGYVALSYAWGPSERGKWIKINGAALHVRRNLYNFLRIISKRQERVSL